MRNLTILALGNSLTAGFGVTTAQAYPALLERKLLAGGYPCRVINAGINGETSGGALSRINRALMVEPDIVILEIGINDHLLGLDPALTAQNIRRMVRLCRDKGVMVILAGMSPGEAFAGDDTAVFARLYPAIATEESISLIPFFLEGVVGHAGLTQADGVHPTAAGYRIVVETIWPYVIGVIDRLMANST